MSYNKTRGDFIKTAIIGSRGLTVNDLGKYLPPDTTEIVSGGAKGVDKCAERYAAENGIPIKVFKPKYELYKKAAPLKRNIEIIEYCDCVVAFWDGKSRGTKYVIDECENRKKILTVITLP